MTTVPYRQVRRTQEERSSAMRARLLDATVECLAEYGYAGTTVTRIADRAGVTRGAQVHHFRTKADLVTAAIAHLAQRRIDLVKADLRQYQPSEDVTYDMLNIIWQMHQGPLFAATVELSVAARTDPELAEQLRGVEPVFSRGVAQAWRVVFSDDEPPVELLHATFTVLDAVRGLLLGSYGLSQEQVDARWRRARKLLHDALEATFGDQLRASVRR